MNYVDDESLPIREISRLTGVNSVTLRAWERRYGLIKPMRTQKGHRLYKSGDIELIRKINSWLARGLAIGKVSELLSLETHEEDVVADNFWQTSLNNLFDILTELNLSKLESFISQLLSVYPSSIIADQLITPSLILLERSLYGNMAKKSLLINRGSEYLAMLTHRQRQQAGGKRIGIIQLTYPMDLLSNNLLQYGLVSKQIKSDIIGVMSPGEVVFIMEKLGLDGLIIYNDSAAFFSEFQKNLFILAEKISKPIIVGGGLVAALANDYPKHVYIAGKAGQEDILMLLDSVFGNDERACSEGVESE